MKFEKQITPSCEITNASVLMKAGLLFWLALFVVACGDNQGMSPADESAATSTDTYRYYEDIALFYDRSESEVYFLLYNHPPSERVQASQIELLGQYEDPARLEIRDGDNDAIREIFLDQEVYGLGVIDGASSVKAILERSEDGEYTLPSSMNSGAIGCNCIEKGATIPDNCDHGGEGAKSCSARDATPLREAACSVYCRAETHLACCTAEERLD